MSSKEPKKKKKLDHFEDPTYQKSIKTTSHSNPERLGILRERDFQKAFRKLKYKFHKLDMEWISDPNLLRKKRSDIEE